MTAMKTNGHDILASRPDLKDRPFGVPEGYFELFKKDMANSIHFSYNFDYSNDVFMG